MSEYRLAATIGYDDVGKRLVVEELRKCAVRYCISDPNCCDKTPVPTFQETVPSSVHSP